MQMRERFCNRKAEAGAVIAFGELAFDLLERAAEAGECFLRNADAAVGNRHDHLAAAGAAAHQNASAIRRELHRVRQQVDHDLLHRAAIRDDRDRAVDPRIEREALAVGAA
ncbi:hypothetical protein CRBSH125_31850 [Afipia carboxidovorans]|nr:hypothetical protein CRBSH125_31850 [Afipia carboxidovorans]